MSNEENKQKKGMFGITTETKDTNNAPLLVATKVENNPQYPSGWKFPIAYLVNIISTPEYEKKDGSTASILQFVFKDKDNRQHIHTEWEIDGGDAKFKEKKDGLDSRIKHIYTSIYPQFPKEGFGTEATTWGEFFSEVKKAFSKTIGEGDDIKLYYPTVPLYYKLTYYKARIGFPLSPNFLERVVKDKPMKLLTINSVWDKLAPTTGGGGGIPGVGTGSSSEDLPTFENEFK